MTWRIEQGDCLELLKTLPDASVDAVITDPPYVIGAVSAGNMATKAGSWSDMMNSSYWFSAWYRDCWRVLTDAGCMWSFCNWRSLPVVMHAATQAQIPITSVLVWDKQWIGPGGQQGLRPRYELVALMAKPGFAIPNRGVSDIHACKWASYKPTGHPAEKPVDLIEWLINTSALPEDATVLDPFSGSGTTGIAAINSGFSFVGFEQERRWYDIARHRLEAASIQPRLDVA